MVRLTAHFQRTRIRFAPLSLRLEREARSEPIRKVVRSIVVRSRRWNLDAEERAWQAATWQVVDGFGLSQDVRT